MPQSNSLSKSSLALSHKKPKLPSSPAEFNRTNLLRIAGELGITTAKRKWLITPSPAEKEAVFIKEVVHHFMARSREQTYKLLFLSNKGGLVGATLMFSPKERLAFLRGMARKRRIPLPTSNDSATEHDVKRVEDALFRREEKRARARFLRKLATRKGVKLPRRAPLAELEQRVRPHLDRGNLNQLAFFFNQKRVSGRRR